MQKTSLCSGWEFKLNEKGPGFQQPNCEPFPWLPATVPGCVHTDLVDNGVIADPFKRMYEAGCQWVDKADWTYRMTLDFQPRSDAPHRILKFQGLDTVCQVFLNDEPIGSHDNFFAPLEIDVSDKLKTGANELRIEFKAATVVSQQRRTEYFAKYGIAHDTNWFDERAFVRKPGYMFGWDWGPRLISCGIFAPVELLEFADRLTSMSLQVTPEEGGVFIVKASADGPAEFAIQMNGGSAEVIGQNSWRVKGDLWWPRGMGAQTLHKVVATSPGADTIEKAFGLRTVELRRDRDAWGESFQFFVNGEPVWARGANWIPNDSFPSRITDEDYANQVAIFADLNMNMLRVWGGGMYESEAFYDACDRHGVLVWQDFPFGCSYYPDDADWQAIIAAEAAPQIERIRSHPSLALWCGNNENETMWEGKWGGPGSTVDRYHGQPIYEETLHKLVAELDPATPYIPTSPTGKSDDPDANVNMNGWGDQHYWDVWHGRGDWAYYAESATRFCSEFGFASCCSMELWNETLEPRDQRPFPSAALHHHNRTHKPWEVFTGMVELHYPKAHTLEEWTQTSQANQKDAMTFAIEHFRRSEYCKGTLIWQANDCWPVQSWALQDYSRRMKPAGEALRRLYADILVSVLTSEGKTEVWVINDGRVAVSGTLSYGGQSVEVTVPPGQRSIVMTAEKVAGVATFSTSAGETYLSA